MPVPRFTPLFGALALAACSHPSTQPPPPRTPAPTAAPAATTAPTPLDSVVADLCSARVVLLGEPGEHGGGETHRLQGELALRLIDECGFDSVLFETGIYDLLALEEDLRGGRGTPDQLARAIGGLWAHAEAATTWIPALFERAAARDVTIAGLDGQVHSTADFAREHLPALIAEPLPEARRAACTVALERYTSWNYDDTHPYDDDVRHELWACADESVAARSTDPRDPALAMARSLRASLADDFAAAGAESFTARDRLMFDNFQWHRARLGEASRSIVWCATVHAARDLTAVPGMEGMVSLGSLVHRELGDDALVLGFTAYTGSWARAGREPRDIVEASPESLEGRFAPDSGIRYVNRDQLVELGELDARPLSFDAPRRARWSDVVDGIVVIRSERPRDQRPSTPAPLRAAYAQDERGGEGRRTGWGGTTVLRLRHRCARPTLGTRGLEGQGRSSSWRTISGMKSARASIARGGGKGGHVVPWSRRASSSRSSSSNTRAHGWPRALARSQSVGGSPTGEAAADTGINTNNATRKRPMHIGHAANGPVAHARAT